MNLTYKEKSLANMTPAQMRQFILWQNTYRDDYDRAIWHSLEALAQFAYLPKSHPKYAVFERVYNKVSAEYKEVA
jgi:hypothetical protein